MASTATGRINYDERGLATIHFERHLPHEIATVWAALTEPTRRAAWFGPTATDGCEGGTIDMVADGPPVTTEVRRMTGRILVWDPPHLLEHEWQQQLIGATTVHCELRSDGGGTILTVTHAGFGRRDAAGYVAGEHAYLDRLEDYLDGKPIRDWTDRLADLQPSYA